MTIDAPLLIDSAREVDREATLGNTNELETAVQTPRSSFLRLRPDRANIPRLFIKLEMV